MSAGGAFPVGAELMSCCSQCGHCNKRKKYLSGLSAGQELFCLCHRLLCILEETIAQLRHPTDVWVKTVGEEAVQKDVSKPVSDKQDSSSACSFA